MIQRTTVCPRDCPDSCALIATIDDQGRLVRMRGDPSHPMTRGFACPRGMHDPQRLYTERIASPALRNASGLQGATWPQALDAVADRLSSSIRDHGPEAVLYLTYAGNTGLLTLDMPQRLWNALGATQTDMALCSRTGHFGISLHYGERYGVTPEDVSASRLIVFWGYNAAVSSTHLWALALEARRKHGARIVVIDPRRSESAARADLWLQPRPGTDVALAYGIIEQLITMRATEEGFLLRWTQGWAELRGVTQEWPAERVSEVTGVPARQLAELSRLYSRVRPNATLIGFGLQKTDHGADQARAVSLIPAVLGQHRGFFYSNGDGLAIDRRLLSGEALADRAPRIVEQVGLGARIAAGEFKFIFISGMNPAVTLPDAGTFAQGLSRDDVFTVVHDTHWTRTTALANAVLPALTYLEKDDLVPPWTHNCVQISPALVAPVTDGRSELWVMGELAGRLGLQQAWLYEDPWPVVQAALGDGLEGGTFADLRAGARLRLERKPRARYSTPSGKIELWSSKAEQLGLPPLPQQAPLPEPDARLLLLNTATPPYTSSQFQEVHGAIPAVVTLHPDDAAVRGIADGDRIRLSTELGTVLAEAHLSEDVAPGIAWSPRQWVGLDGTPQNVLFSGQPQEMGKGPRFNSTLVAIERATVR